MNLVGQTITPEMALRIASGDRHTKMYYDLLRARKGESNRVENMADELEKLQRKVKELELQNTKLKLQTNGKQIVMPLKNVG